LGKIDEFRAILHFDFDCMPIPAFDCMPVAAFDYMAILAFD
tara:strand:+ start:378 stop:500 length:123 start_codon:yes stop_codon:yes gene_type:complete